MVVEHCTQQPQSLPPLGGDDQEFRGTARRRQKNLRCQRIHKVRWRASKSNRMQLESFFLRSFSPIPMCDWATTFLHRLPSKQTVGERSEQNAHKARMKLGHAIGYNSEYGPLRKQHCPLLPRSKALPGTALLARLPPRTPHAESMEQIATNQKPSNHNTC